MDIKKLSAAATLLLISVFTLTQAGYALRGGEPDADKVTRSIEEAKKAEGESRKTDTTPPKDDTGGTLASGQTISLDAISKDRIITTTADLIVTTMTDAQKAEIVNLINQGYILAVATANGDQAYLNEVIGKFENPDLIKQYISEGNVIFSLVGDSSILAAIQDLAKQELFKLDDSRLQNTKIVEAIISGQI